MIKKRLSIRDKASMFADAISQLLREKGATEHSNELDGFGHIHSVLTLPTVGGILNVRINRSEQFVWTVWCRFDDYELAKEHFPVGLNPKYNLHLNYRFSLEEAIKEATEFFKYIN